MNRPSLTQRSRAAVAAGGLALVASLVPARADTKIVSEVVMTGAPRLGGGPGARPGGPPPQPEGGTVTEPPPPPPDQTPSPVTRTVTTYYRGDKARVEDGSGGVILYDLKAGKVYRLDATAKTYTVLPMKRLLQATTEDGGGGPMGGRMRMKAEAKLKVEEQDESRSIGERDAHRMAVTGTLTLRPESGGMGPGGGPGGGGPRGGPGGGFPGGGGPRGGPGGGFPGGRPGGGPGGGSPGGGRPGGPHGGFPATRIEGEYWVTRAVVIAGTSRKSKMPLLPLIAQSLPADPLIGALLKPITEKLGKAKAFPLASRVTLVLPQRRPAEPDAGGQRPASRPEEGPSKRVVVTTEVRSISEETLEDALFAVPTDYTRAQTPAGHVDPEPRSR